MTNSYWNTQSDPYQYSDSPILKNLPDIRNASVLEVFEQRMTTLRLEETMLAIADAPITFATWKIVHRILFQDVYAWAGEIRTVQLAKGNTVFALPEHIAAEANRIFSDLEAENLPVLSREVLIPRIAYYFGELNVLHPFREGNGRTQKLLFDEMVRRCGYNIDWAKMGVDVLLQAVIAAFHKQDFAQLEQLFDAALR